MTLGAIAWSVTRTVRGIVGKMVHILSSSSTTVRLASCESSIHFPKVVLVASACAVWAAAKSQILPLWLRWRWWWCWRRCWGYSSAIWGLTQGALATARLAVIAPNPVATSTVAASSGGDARQANEYCGNKFVLSHYDCEMPDRHKAKQIQALSSL